MTIQAYWQTYASVVSSFLLVLYCYWQTNNIDSVFIESVIAAINISLSCMFALLYQYLSYILISHCVIKHDVECTVCLFSDFTLLVECQEGCRARKCTFARRLSSRTGEVLGVTSQLWLDTKNTC